MIKIRFHAMFSLRDASKLGLDYDPQKDNTSVYFEVNINAVDTVLNQIRSVRPELQYTFVSSNGGYYYVY